MMPRYQDRWDRHGGGYEPRDVKDDAYVDRVLEHADDDEEVWCG